MYLIDALASRTNRQQQQMLGFQIKYFKLKWAKAKTIKKSNTYTINGPFKQVDNNTASFVEDKSSAMPMW